MSWSCSFVLLNQQPQLGLGMRSNLLALSVLLVGAILLCPVQGGEGRSFPAPLVDQLPLLEARQGPSSITTASIVTSAVPSVGFGAPGRRVVSSQDSAGRGAIVVPQLPADSSVSLMLMQDRSGVVSAAGMADLSFSSVGEVHFLSGDLRSLTIALNCSSPSLWIEGGLDDTTSEDYLLIGNDDDSLPLIFFQAVPSLRSIRIEGHAEFSEQVLIRSLPESFTAELHVDLGLGNDTIVVDTPVAEMDGLLLRAGNVSVRHSLSGTCPVSITTSGVHTVAAACTCTFADAIYIEADAVIVANSVSTEAGSLTIIGNTGGVSVTTLGSLTSASGAITVTGSATGTSGITLSGPLSSDSGDVFITGDSTTITGGNAAVLLLSSVNLGPTGGGALSISGDGINCDGVSIPSTGSLDTTNYDVSISGLCDTSLLGPSRGIDVNDANLDFSGGSVLMSGDCSCSAASCVCFGTELRGTSSTSVAGTTIMQISGDATGNGLMTSSGVALQSNANIVLDGVSLDINGNIGPSTAWFAGVYLAGDISCTTAPCDLYVSADVESVNAQEFQAYAIQGNQPSLAGLRDITVTTTFNSNSGGTYRGIVWNQGSSMVTATGAVVFNGEGRDTTGLLISSGGFTCATMSLTGISYMFTNGDTAMLLRTPVTATGEFSVWAEIVGTVKKSHRVLSIDPLSYSAEYFSFTAIDNNSERDIDVMIFNGGTFIATGTTDSSFTGSCVNPTGADNYGVLFRTGTTTFQPIQNSGKRLPSPPQHWRPDNA